ncbi:MAG: DsbE family thiol:disulfide interchange protein [Gammaproteobacteria bacterium]
MPKWLIRIIPLFLFVAVALLMWRGLSLDPRALPSALIDKPMPAFDLPRLDDLQAGFSDKDLNGQVVLVNVWASWCVACRDEHPILMNLARETGIPIYGLNYKDGLDNARSWLSRYGDPYQMSGFDQDGRTAIDWGFYGVPETFLIDTRGIIRYKHAGVLTPEIWQNQFLPVLDVL